MKVAVLVLSYNDLKHLDECYQSLLSQTYPCDLFHVNNSSPDAGAAFVKEKFPSITIINLEKNFGYAGAYNRVLAECFSNNSPVRYDAALLLNSDTKVSADCVTNFVNFLNTYTPLQGEQLGLVQPAILLYDDPTRINTVGNSMHYLGFGFCKDLHSIFDPSSPPKKILSVSGCAMFISKEYWESIGTLNEEFFMYNEDQNYSWRGLLRGYTHYCIPSAVVYHKYSFSNSSLRWYNSEKNRWMMLLENYELKTLIVFAPILVFIEFAVLFYACKTGWRWKKICSYFYIIKNYRLIYSKRVLIQQSRTESDPQLLRSFDTSLSFGPVTSGMIDKLLNIILARYALFAFKLLSVMSRSR